jgi:hypothetical protein
MTDIQGQIKDNIQQVSNQPVHNQNQKDQNPIDYFSHDQAFVFVYKKTEKLATALYMITNLFGDKEPMKWTLRTQVSHLLSFIIGFKDILQSREDEFSHEVKTKVLEIVSLLDVSAQSGLVSPMNFSVVKQEFMNLISGLSQVKQDTHIPTHNALSTTFFDTAPHVDQRQINVQKNVFDNLHSKKTDIKENKESLMVEFPLKKTNRQHIIIGLLKKKKEVTIKDIAQIIKDCSEKTIQRELIALIDQHVLKKTGERRWSKYSLLETVV